MTFIGAFITTLSITSFLMIPYTSVVLTLFFNNVSLTKRLKKSWMTATLELVEAIFLGWLQLRKSFALGTFGPRYLKIVMIRLKNSHLVILSIQKSIPTLVRYTLSSPFALFPKGGLNLCIISLPHPGAWLHYCSCGIFHKMGWGNSYICIGW